MIDAHAHLQDEAFDGDVFETMRRARDAGVEAVVCASVDFADSVACLELAREWDRIHAAVGLAPYSDLSELDAVLQLVEDSPDAVAVGEVGLDYKYEKRPEQLGPFREQVKLAMELDVPVVVHSRSAGKYALRELEGLGAEKVVMHAFDGSVKHARQGFELGYYFSIPLTVSQSRQKQELAREVPVEQLLLETDSPVLNPGKGRNEPANLLLACNAVAELRGMDPGEVGKLTGDNARRIFDL